MNYLNQLIENYGLQANVSWLGTKTPAEVATELSRCTLFVLPTLMDNSPNCLAEAMAVGVPSIATKVGGIPSMVDDKRDGMLYEKHDIEGLVNVVKLLLTDRCLLNKISVNARKRAFERNFPAEVSKKYITVYKSLMNGKS
jgi:glycosyltransferase involved in cell wall biosynthesis